MSDVKLGTGPNDFGSFADISLAINVSLSTASKVLSII